MYYVTAPVAVVVGFVGYNVEGWLRSDERVAQDNRHRPTIAEQKSERELAQLRKDMGEASPS